MALFSDFSEGEKTRIRSLLDEEPREAVAFCCLRFCCDDASLKTLHMSLSLGNWKDDQLAVQDKMHDELDLVRQDPELQEKALLELKEKYLL